MLRTTLTVLLTMLFSGCASQGPSRIQPDRFDYNQAIARSANEQMLLNLVRLRYSETPVFLAVSSVLTQYSYAGQIGASGFGGASLGDPLWQVGVDGRFVYIERPTITYAPLTGDEFAEQVLTPIPTEMVFSLVDSGWPPRQLLLMSLYRMNDEFNMGFEPTPEGLQRFDDFESLVDQLIALARRDALEVQKADATNEDRFLVFDENADAETQRLIGELKRTLDLEPERSSFRVTHRHMNRKPDEVTMRVRSILELMGFLSQGVEIPEAHWDQQFTGQSSGAVEQTQRRIPLRVQAQVERPENAFVAVYFQDHWFFIEQSDHASKQAFGLLAYLFQLQAPQQIQAGPMLTVPTG